ncbi:MAG: heme o synthase [Rhodospirillales bacterium]|jgi:protoheme IX farnesyltransferase|nr:heme o synthase [Rhodospirillales bacterium]
MAAMTEVLGEPMEKNIAESEAAAPQGGRRYRARSFDYALILKPRVMSLVVFVGLVGLLLAPGAIAPWTGAVAVACIALAAGASGAINMWYDRDIDLNMGRTRDRPIPSGRMAPGHALVIGVVLAGASIATMALVVNLAAAGLLALTVLYYVFVYTVWLKRRTPQNIVIGGAAGAFPPVIGWAAVTGAVSVESLSLFAIIFLWTPPHSWALALFSNEDYTRAGVPMLPVVAGGRETRRHILIYTGLMIAATFVPVALGMSGAVYGVAAAVLGAGFVRHALRVWRDETDKAARPMFGYSILYLFLIFVFLLVDRAAPVVL